jgi:hypothetical protein
MYALTIVFLIIRVKLLTLKPGNGWDFYCAHAVNPDQNLYYTVMNRTRDIGPNGEIGMNEARIWQRRIYSGLVSMNPSATKNLSSSSYSS